MNPSVILSGAMEPQLRQIVETACATEGLRCSLWNSSQVLTSNEQQLVVLVGELVAGSRNLPEALTALATRQFPQAAMIVFCNEPLARKSKTVHHGRLTLVGPPPDLETVSTTLRAAFGLSRSSMTKSVNVGGIRQLRGRRWWAGCISQGEGGATDSKRVNIPFMDGQPETGVGFWLPETNANVDPLQIETGLDLLGSEASESRFGKSGKAPLAAMTLNLTSNKWKFFHSNPNVTCWLLSHKRFPHSWHLSGNGSVNAVQRLVAAGGDVLAVWHDPHQILKAAGNESTHLDSELLLAAECGGHALLDLLNTQASKTDKAFSAIVAEVR